MAIKDDWEIGTITLIAGEVDFVTVGSALQTGGIQRGDTILLPAKGMTLIVEEITGENAGKLSDPCPAAAAGGGQKLRIRFQPDGTRYSATSQGLMERLNSGNLEAFSGLAGEIEKLPIFTGAGAMGLIDKSDLIAGVNFDVQVPTLADRAAYDASPKDFKVLVSNIGDGRSALYVKTFNTLGQWSAPSYISGPVGPPPSVSVVAPVTLAPGAPATVNNVGTPTAPSFEFGIPQGHRGWIGQYAVVPDGLTRNVLKLTDWIGGTGTKPTDNIGSYLGPAGFVTDIASAVSVKGDVGSQGPTGTPWQGAWSIGTAYLANDLVVDNDAGGLPALWIAKRNNTGKKPKDNAADWDLFPASFATTSDYGLITESPADTRDYGSITS